MVQRYNTLDFEKAPINAVKHDFTENDIFLTPAINNIKLLTFVEIEEIPPINRFIQTKIKLKDSEIISSIPG
ncbi:hypothetical protein HZS_896 [Henneguya salminicola]|nr:hypothetical protein HZS_896 [Henneguya salminicola]